MTTFEIMNYDGKKKAIEVDEIIFPFSVTVITGDEVITMNGKEYDAAKLFDNLRTKDYYDGEYTVTEDMYDDWCKRDCTANNEFLTLDSGYVMDTFFDSFL